MYINKINILSPQKFSFGRRLTKEEEQWNICYYKADDFYEVVGLCNSNYSLLKRTKHLYTDIIPLQYSREALNKIRGKMQSSCLTALSQMKSIVNFTYTKSYVIKTLDEHNNSEAISDLYKYASDHDYNSFVCSSGTATAIQESSLFKAESNSESNYPMAIYNVGSISDDNSKDINVFVNPTMTWDNSTIYFAHENKLSTIYIDDISFDNLDDYYTQLTIKFRIK